MARSDVLLDGWPFPAATRWGDLLVLSGLAALDVETHQPLAGGADEQAAAIFGLLDEILEHAGAAREDVLRLECFLADRSHFAVWNAAFARAFPSRPPARTTVIASPPVAGLHLELQAIVGVGGGGSGAL